MQHDRSYQAKTAFLGDVTRITLNKAGHYIQTAMLMKALGHIDKLTFK